MFFYVTDDVKSLTLPGTYHEKINNLGFSLQNFTRLQHLDLSKNSIVSLKVREIALLILQIYTPSNNKVESTLVHIMLEQPYV